jgi:hypothetical protein
VTCSKSVSVGSTGTPASATMAFVSILLCTVPSVLAGGPTQIIPAPATSAANPGSSASRPSPGWMAFTPARLAAAMIRSPRRYVDSGVPPDRWTA